MRGQKFCPPRRKSRRFLAHTRTGWEGVKPAAGELLPLWKRKYEAQKRSSGHHPASVCPRDLKEEKVPSKFSKLRKAAEGMRWLERGDHRHPGSWSSGLSAEMKAPVQNPLGKTCFVLFFETPELLGILLLPYCLSNLLFKHLNTEIY